MSNKEEMQLQLGMNPSTAHGALRKMVLFKLVKMLDFDICFQCGEQILDVKDLSIEHKEPWLHTEDPLETFFDLDNIAFSHRSCNSAAGRRPNKKYESKQEYKKAMRENERLARVYDPMKRKAQYERTGK